MLLKLALRNIFRQRIRSVITLIAIVFGVVGLILSGGFVKDIFVQLGEAIIQSETGHVQVFREGFREKGSRQPDRYLIDEPAPVADRIASSPQVREVASRLSFSGLLNNGKRDLGIIGEGVEPDRGEERGTGPVGGRRELEHRRPPPSFSTETRTGAGSSPAAASRRASNP